MNILITGASGGIGQEVLRRLLDSKKHRLFVLSRSLRKESVGEGYDTRVGDLLDKGSLEKACEGIDLIVHSAGLTHSSIRKRYFDVNFNGTKNLLEIAEKKQVKKFVFLSSRSASKTGGAYAQSKLMAEEWLMKSKIDWVVLSVAEVYGTKKGEAISSLINQVKNNSFVFIPGNGSYELCPVFVSDVVLVVEKVLDLSIVNKKYIIAGPRSFSYENLVDHLLTKFSRSVFKVFIPLWFLKFISLIFPQFLVRDQVSRLTTKKPNDISLAREELGFAPIDIDEGLKRLGVLLP